MLRYKHIPISRRISTTPFLHHTPLTRTSKKIPLIQHSPQLCTFSNGSQISKLPPLNQTRRNQQHPHHHLPKTRQRPHSHRLSSNRLIHPLKFQPLPHPRREFRPLKSLLMVSPRPTSSRYSKALLRLQNPALLLPSMSENKLVKRRT